MVEEGAMPIPKVGELEMMWVTSQVAGYIEDQRERYRGNAVVLSEEQKRAMGAFFPAAVLDNTKTLRLTGERIRNPGFYTMLAQFGVDPSALPDFSRMAAMTLVDTIVSHEEFTDRLLFHELVHVVQFERLGLKPFAKKYVRGFLAAGSCEEIPLEKQAYELDGRFAATPGEAIRVEEEVNRWMREERY